MNVSGATAPWTRLSMKTEFATKDYVLDVKKDLKNIIVQIFYLNSIFSTKSNILPITLDKGPNLEDNALKPTISS